ncbi:MAG: hypothetical protein M1817_001438 [Caeruleum heppii]|nr:MAG: hypothetical protein M1817_001438 [Caeruleum heppii]
MAISFLDHPLYGLKLWRRSDSASNNLLPVYPLDRESMIYTLRKLFWIRNRFALNRSKNPKMAGATSRDDQSNSSDAESASEHPPAMFRAAVAPMTSSIKTPTTKNPSTRTPPSKTSSVKAPSFRASVGAMGATPGRAAPARPHALPARTHSPPAPLDSHKSKTPLQDVNEVLQSSSGDIDQDQVPLIVNNDNLSEDPDYSPPQRQRRRTKRSLSADLSIYAGVGKDALRNTTRPAKKPKNVSDNADASRPKKKLMRSARKSASIHIPDGRASTPRSPTPPSEVATDQTARDDLDHAGGRASGNTHSGAEEASALRGRDKTHPIRIDSLEPLATTTTASEAISGEVGVKIEDGIPTAAHSPPPAEFTEGRRPLHVEYDRDREDEHMILSSPTFAGAAGSAPDEGYRSTGDQGTIDSERRSIPESGPRGSGGPNPAWHPDPIRDMIIRVRTRTALKRVNRLWRHGPLTSQSADFIFQAVSNMSRKRDVYRIECELYVATEDQHYELPGLERGRASSHWDLLRQLHGEIGRVVRATGNPEEEFVLYLEALDGMSQGSPQ